MKSSNGTSKRSKFVQQQQLERRRAARAKMLAEEVAARVERPTDRRPGTPRRVGR